MANINTIGEMAQSQPQKVNWFFVRYFRYGYKGGRELNVKIGRYQMRIARHQFALWSRYDALFNYLF